MKTCVIYARVSNKQQADAFGLRAQLDSCRAWADANGYRVLEEFTDEGGKNSKRDTRPEDRDGFGRLLEFVSASSVDVVIAGERSRYGEYHWPGYCGWLLGQHGTEARALNDTGNSYGDSMVDTTSGEERIGLKRRTRNGRLKKARDGMVVGGHNRAYGFDWVRDPKGKVVGYEVNEAEMNTVRRIFSEIAAGTGTRTVKNTLDREHVPTPNGGESWSRPFLNGTIVRDLYKPHTTAELRQLGVSEDVLRNLDAESVYGVYWYDGQDYEGEKFRVPVPVPDAGIQLAVFIEARRQVKSRTRTPERSTSRPWELRSILFCEDCGRRMQTHSPDATKGYFYYRCPSLQAGHKDTCMMNVKVRADSIEPKVWALVRDTLDDKHYVLEQLEKQYEQRRRDLRRPGADAAALFKQLDRIESDARKDWEAYRADVIDLPKLKELRAIQDNERAAVEREMERNHNRDAELEKLNADEAAMRERIEAGYGDLSDTTPEKRRQVYEDVGLRVEVGLEKIPRISGIFPVGRFGDEELTLVTTPDQSGHIITTSKSPHDEPPFDGPRHAVYSKDSDGRWIGRELTSSRRDGRSRRRSLRERWSPGRASRRRGSRQGPGAARA